MSNVDPKRLSASLDVTLGRCAKELTGPLVHTYQCLAHTVAVARAFPLTPGLTLTPEERREAFATAYTEVYTLLEATQEPVMDYWKPSEWKKLLPEHADEIVADALQKAVNGEPLDEVAFGLFIPGDLHPLLHRVLDAAGFCLRNVRKSHSGRVISGGRNWRSRYKTVDLMLKNGHKPHEILPLLEQGMVGEAIVRLKVSKQDEAEKPILPGEGENAELLSPAEEAALEACSQVPGLTIQHFPIGSLRELVEAVRFKGEPIYRLVKPPKVENGLLTATLRLALPWKARTEQGESMTSTGTFEISLPDPWAKGMQVTADGHVRLRLSGGKTRMYRPVLFVTRAQEVGMKRAEQWLADVLLEGALAADRLWGTVTGPRMKEAVGDALRAAFMKLTLATEDKASRREALIRRSQYQVQFPARDSIKGGWRVKRAVLLPIGAAGYCLYATSKNHPGTIVTKTNARGIPGYKATISPFARFQDGKRLCEEPEMRQALTLWRPDPLLVRSPKAKPLPEELAECFTQLTVMVADAAHVNRFLKPDGDPNNPDDWTDNDTFVGFPSITEKVAIGEISWEAESPAERDALMARLLFEQDADPTRLTVDTLTQEVAAGLVGVTWRLTYTGRWDEVGKLKAAVGGGKGVFGILPYQPFYKLGDGTVVPIDLMLPRATVGEDGKKMLEMVLHMLAAKAGITEIDDTLGLDELVALIRWRLEQEDRDPDGMEQIWVQNPDGTVTIAGKALCGPVPFYRPKQTASNQFRVRQGMHGIKVHPHAMVMGVRRDAAGAVVDRIRFRGTVAATDPETGEVTQVPAPWGNEPGLYHRFMRLIQAREALKRRISELTEAEPNQAPARPALTPEPEAAPDPGMERLATLHQALTSVPDGERAPLPEAPPEESETNVPAPPPYDPLPGGVIECPENQGLAQLKQLVKNNPKAAADLVVWETLVQRSAERAGGEGHKSIAELVAESRARRTEPETGS